MIDLGYKFPKMEAMPCSPGEKQKDQVRYPQLCLGSEYGDGPEINLGKLSVGSEIDATVKLKVKQIGEKTNEDGKTKRYYSFDVISIDLPNKKSAEELKSERLQAAKKTYGGMA